MFLSWHSHCTLLVMSRDVVYKPTSLVQCLEKVTVLQCTPSFLQMVGSKPLKERIFSAQSALRILALGGEIFLTKSTVNRYLQNAPSNLRVFNIFGISELSSWASIYEVDIKRLANAPNHPCEGVSCDWLPIGEALSETRLEVWNDDNEAIVPPREGVGNLVVGSDKRLCYIEDDGGDGEYDMKYCQEKVQEMRFTGDLAFITANGQIYLCGRKDDKIKRMGQFVSLATLTKMVEDIPFVEQCCTVYHDRSLITFVKLAEDNGNNTLVDSINDRHISNGNTVIAMSKTREIEKVGNKKVKRRINTPLSNKNVTLETDIKRFVRSRLSSSYLPDVIQFVDIIPINKNGKSDSKALIRDYLNRKKGNSTDNSSIKSSLRDIYCLALNLGSNVLENKTFAELGGDSFAALYVVNTLVHQYFQTEIDGNLCEEIFNKILTSSYRDFYEYFEQLADSFALVELKNDKENGTLSNGSTTSNSVIPDCESVQGYKYLQNDLSSSNEHYLNKSSRKESECFQNDRVLDEYSISSSIKSSEEISNSENGESVQHQCLRNQSSVTEKNQFYAITSQNKVFCSDSLVESKIQIPSSKTITPDPTNLTNFPIKDKHNPCINLKVKRKQNLGKCIDASPLVVYSHVLDEPLVLIGCHSKRFVALTTEGVLKWELETNGRIESSATLTADGRFCVFGCHDGFIYFVDIKSGDIYWKYKTNDIVKSSPVSYNTTSTNGYEYCVTSIACHDKVLYSLDHINKKVLWKVPTNSLCCSSPLVNPTENTLYVTLLSGKLTAFDSVSGRKKWEFNTGKPIFTSPMFSRSKTQIVFGCVDNVLYCVSSEDGNLVWKFESEGHIFSSPICVKHPRNPDVECICFGSNDGSLYVLNDTGDLIWKTFPCPTPIVSSPAVLYVRCYKRLRKRHLADSFDKHHDKSGKNLSATDYERTSKSLKRGDTESSKQDLKQSKESSSEQDNENFKNFNKFLSSGSKILNTLSKECSVGSKAITIPSSDDLIVPLLFSVTTKGEFDMYDLETGKRVEITGLLKFKGEVFSSPVVIGNGIVIGCRDDFLYFIDVS
ncbi:beta-alanine-activating enzyme-like [Clytia hemisphaerica]